MHEIFGWRQFANRRELAGCLGLTPTPYASGDNSIEQGISWAGNRRARGSGAARGTGLELAAFATGQYDDQMVHQVN
ncbi:transposase [Variovorax ginsengisoli]|uniref:Transposase n=1 Tax=Variovorax ginsengisoli TaxID=363844 RepID=A0ABT8SH91_9BURK|nr:transposase [Variovorax ginsengisoli]MDN8618940.1 transposase [Variovorax ginsengisoli]MDO1538110.1 transposase [Variovorax ginsengisoli]